MKIPRRDLIDEMMQAGFELEKEFKFLPYQYSLIFTAPDSVIR
jgi:hypothetical protein